MAQNRGVFISVDELAQAMGNHALSSHPDTPSKFTLIPSQFICTHCRLAFVYHELQETDGVLSGMVVVLDHEPGA